MVKKDHNKKSLKELGQEIMSDASWMLMFPSMHQVHQKHNPDFHQGTKHWYAHLAFISEVYQTMYSTNYSIATAKQDQPAAASPFQKPDSLNAPSLSSIENSSEIWSVIDDMIQPEEYSKNEDHKRFNDFSNDKYDTSWSQQTEERSFNNEKRTFETDQKWDLDGDKSSEDEHLRFLESETHDGSDELNLYSEDELRIEESFKEVFVTTYQTDSDKAFLDPEENLDALDHHLFDSESGKINGFDDLVKVISANEHEEEKNRTEGNRAHNPQPYQTSNGSSERGAPFLTSKYGPQSGAFNLKFGQEDTDLFEEEFNFHTSSERLFEDFSQRILKSFRKYYGTPY